MKKDNQALFAEMPVRKAVLALAIPTVISQIITVIYNVADTFFVGQLNDPNQVAATSLIMPLFLALTGCANLFGIGGASLIARSLGRGDRERVKHTSVFCIWTAGGLAFLFSIAMYFLRPLILPLVGANTETFSFCYQYLFWTITVGGVPTTLSMMLAHLIRAEGYSKEAGFGVALGGILNMILDPVFIFGFRLEIVGAAVATMLSNLISMGYFAALMFRKREALTITVDPRYYTWGMQIPGEVIAVGLPSCVMTVMSILSNTVLNSIMAGFSNVAMAGTSIAKRVDMIAFAVANGITQGTLPLIGYTYSSGNRDRMRAAIRIMTLYVMGIGLVVMAILLVGADGLTRLFIDHAETVEYGRRFLRIIALACPLTGANSVVLTVFQATGQKRQPFIMSLLRKGCADVPLMLLFCHFFGVSYVIWSTPLADLLCLLVGLAMFLPYLKKLNAPAEK